MEEEEEEEEEDIREREIERVRNRDALFLTCFVGWFVAFLLCCVCFLFLVFVCACEYFSSLSVCVFRDDVF